MALLDDMGKNLEKEMAKARVRQDIAIARIRGDHAKADQLARQLYKIGL
jgi:hypothetical protein